MIHHATSGFWECYQRLPMAIQQLADKNYEVLKADADHPTLHFKKVGPYRSVRVGIAYRALGIERETYPVLLNHRTHRTHGNKSFRRYVIFPCVRCVPWFPGLR